jgi:hypothetical protein
MELKLTNEPVIAYDADIIGVMEPEIPTPAILVSTLLRFSTPVLRVRSFFRKGE